MKLLNSTDMMVDDRLLKGNLLIHVLNRNCNHYCSADERADGTFNCELLCSVFVLCTVI